MNLHAWLTCNRTGGMSFQGFAYEYAVEITYPQPEATSAALLNAASQV